MNRRVMARIAIAVLAVSLVLAAAGAASASNGKGKGKGHNDGTVHGQAHAVANTKMTFRLDDHTVAVGDPVSGPVALFTHDGNHWAPLAGASLNVLVDGVDTGTPLTTDANGDATVSITAAGAGDHVVKVVYAGDDTHRRRHRAQGFEASDTSTTSGTDGSTDGSGDTSGDTSG
jgi:plastocyanin